MSLYYLIGIGSYMIEASFVYEKSNDDNVVADDNSGPVKLRSGFVSTR